MKEIKNNRIIYDNHLGRVAQHDIWLNQGVRFDDSPTFANLHLTGDINIDGNLYVLGNTSIFNTALIEFEDNILLLNKAETGNGVTLNQGGIEIDRGTLENFRIIYNESNKRAEIGVVSNLEPIAIRESIPLNSGVMIWDSTTSRIESRNTIVIPITYSSTVNSVSSTTGTLIVAGGVGIKKDVFIDGKVNFVGSSLPNYSSIYTDPATNTLNLTSPQNINLTANQRIVVPYNIPVVFGATTQAISANNVTNKLSIISGGDIDLTPSINKSINVPNQIPITFSTQNEKVYTDSSNNMVIAGSQDIYLYPNNGNAGGKKVFIPVNTALAFSNVNQNINSNLNNDLIINAGNNILLNPGSSLNVKLPTNNGIIFGGGGLQRISANSNNELNIVSVGDIFLTPDTGSAINIPNSIPITFFNDSQTISGDTNGNLLITAQNEMKSFTPIFVSNTTNSLNATTGSIHTNGGLGVKKTIISESDIIISSQNSESLKVKNDDGNLFVIDSSNSYGKVNIYTGDGTSSNPSLEISDTSLLNASSLIQLKSAFDPTLGYMIGRGSVILNGGRLLSLNLPDYSVYSNLGNRPRFSILSNNTELFSVESGTGNIVSIGAFELSNTEESISPSSGSFVVKGGLGVVKNIYIGGKVNISTDSIDAFEIRNSSLESLLNVDTISKILNIYQHVIIDTTSISNNTQAFAIMNNGNTLLNIDSNNNTLNTSLQTLISNTNDSSDTSYGSLIASGGVAIQKKLNVGGAASFASGINMINTKITNLQDPVDLQDAATMNYVNLIKQGLYVKDSVNVATTTLQTLSADFAAGNVIDSYTLVINDRILIKNQTNQIENGIYKITNTTPTRTLDFQSGNNAAGIFVFVKYGSINASLGFICNSVAPNDIIDTNSLNFTQFTGLGQVQVNKALSKIFNEINVNVDDSSIEIDSLSNALRIKNTAVSTGLTGGSGTALTTTPDQSHVNKLGTINTGIWEGSVVQVSYGGTGRATLNDGNILFGKTTGPIGTDSNFFYDTTNVRLGLGTNNPSEDFEIKSTNTTSLLLNADSDANNLTAKPEIILQYSGTKKSYLTMSRNYNDYATNIHSNALVISNDQTNTTSIIQLATNHQARMTILSNGFTGINTSNPTTTLQVSGTFDVSGLVTFKSPDPSINSSTGAVVVTGGLSIDIDDNSVSVNNGGALTVNGGASIGKDLYVGGSINGDSGTTNALGYITVTATDESINATTGSLITFGGITIQAEGDAYSVTNGGSLLTLGGASIGKSLYVGSTIYGLADTYLGNLYFTSNATDNYIEAHDNSRTTNSFLPINFTQYNNTQENILTIADSGIVLPINHSLQIGGTLLTPDGYTFSYITDNLKIIPNSALSTYSINIGTIGNYSNLNIYGNGNGLIRWQSSTSNLLLTNSTIQLNKLNSSGSIVLTTPNTSGISFLKAISTNMTLNIGSGSTAGQLTTILSNDIGDSTITFTPSNITNSSLVLTSNIDTTFNGSVNNTNRVEYSGNALHQTINNTNGNSMWTYLGQISTGGTEKGYCEIDFNNGVNTTSNNISGLKLTVAINDTTCIASHLHYGNITFNSTQKPICYIYNDTINDYHLFVKLAPISETNINVTTQRNTKFSLLSEGILSAPNGTFSGYTGSWTEEYKTNIESTLKYTLGDLTVEGNTMKIADNLPIIGYNNINTISDRDIGLLLQRYQIANNSGTGNIVDPGDSPMFTDSLPSQTGIVGLSQLRLSSLASLIDDFYTGTWLKIISGSNINQVRQVIAYNGAQQVITIATPFLTQLPSLGDTISFYYNNFMGNYFDSRNNTFALGYVTVDPNMTYLTSNNDANLRLKSLYSTDTTVSTNASSGSIKLLGGISINNTNDAVSSTYGGTFTSSGGVGIQKNLLVGANIGLGGSGFVPQESLHIRKTTATSRFENNTGSYSYIDFSENGTNNRYGILLDSAINEFCLTNTTSGQNPNNSNKALTINNLGYIGINTTTNVVSPLSLNTNNFISTNSSTGYLGLIGAAYNTDDNSVASRILLHANSQTSINQGTMKLYAGNTSAGNVRIFTNNDIERVRVEYNGSVNIFSTTVSDNNTTGALIVTGGLGIRSSQNASSFSSGGSITTPGGVAIGKDIYIGGSLFVNGSFTVAGAVTSPTILQGTLVNCSLFTFFSLNFAVNGNLGVLTFGLSVTPDNTSENCQVSVILPSRTNNFTTPFECISNASGYTDNTSIIPLFNVLSHGLVGTNELNVKFQSVSTNIHYFQIQCTYILA
jgi:hypothetical protein